MIVYKAKNLINGKFYIGITKKTLARRSYVHIWKSREAKTHFQRAINKYGSENFKWEIIDTAKNQDELWDLERKYIVELKPHYNSTSGGEGSKDMSLATREKIGKIHKGKVLSDSTKEKIRQANLGKKNSPESRLKMSIACKAYWARVRSQNV